MVQVLTSKNLVMPHGSTDGLSLYRGHVRPPPRKRIYTSSTRRNTHTTLSTITIIYMYIYICCYLHMYTSISARRPHKTTIQPISLRTTSLSSQEHTLHITMKAIRLRTFEPYVPLKSLPPLLTHGVKPFIICWL